ncbi:MAG: ABC transporter permease subunit [Armatimonadota bacterium]|nr:ABC transporter permease subunit [Armatimonadota bacterium]MDR7450217.1 ABC transporter permease subunit [Armatimonadota bacterium]MDR7460700.1 ABC transporter permease subunit [Armatimonadota bacterium]MDR7478870.1 ABC transporter permease subunit [Armatimonadota bacterium]MDR7487584.1 ABC transporter permease subunit [Armatimonadota bacterium]
MWRALGWADAVVVLTIATVLAVGVRLATGAPGVAAGPAITLAPAALPWYTGLSVSRMAAAYALSLGFTLVYGYAAAYNRRAERILLPVLDVLQSVPILSFLPVVLLALSAVLPVPLAAELASVLLIFTSQVWNLTFAWYQALTTVPTDLREASRIFRLSPWLRLRVVELPFAAPSLVWNSMMSWAGGWFFLMAAEMFTVGRRDFRLPGLGAYLKQAAVEGDVQALVRGLLALVLVIVLLDQLVWRPLLAWADRFKLELVEASPPPRSWFYDAWSASALAAWLGHRVLAPAVEWLDTRLGTRWRAEEALGAHGRPWRWAARVVLTAAAALLAWQGARAVGLLVRVPPASWAAIVLGLMATSARVAAALVVALAWTLPVGVAIGMRPRLAAWVQPLTQIAASIPATAVFPALLVILTGVPGGLTVAAVVLMLLGAQWYLLFNIIAGAAAIPAELRQTVTLLQLGAADRWRVLLLPALFPFLVTGVITAAGGAWNASIVAEYVEFGGRTLTTTGIGALIARATAGGDYSLLLAATLAMILAVVAVNRLVWRRLYRLAEESFRMD